MTITQVHIDQVQVGNSADIDFSAVITLYNEEENVAPLTRNLISAFKQNLPGKPFELVLVLNGPQDKTPEIAADLAREFPEITLVTLKENQGYGGGIQAGLSIARGPLIGYLCGDEQIDAADVARIFNEALQGGHDLVKVTRQVRQDGIQRVLVTRIYNTLFKVMFGSKSSDI